jgi:UDP-N-acetylglucosamine/UDP-N-acetylgalactosamine diphosphorylase
MTKGRSNAEQAVIDRIHNAGQAHLFSFWDDLSDQEKDTLINQASEIEIEWLTKLIEHYESHEKNEPRIEPCHIITTDESTSNMDALNLGFKALNNREIGLLTVAGGQGSRLGYEHPKGCYPVSTVTGKSLFQVFAEKIVAYSKIYGYNIPWYIMTSRSNNAETIQYFKDHDFFGLEEDKVVFFSQAMNPSVTEDGKLILKEKSRIFMNPDGHGGTIKALCTQGLLDSMYKNGIKHLSFFQVDNPLVHIVDPAFIGNHISSGSDVSSKVIPKDYPEEKLGAAGIINGKPGIIEYSDLSEKDMYATGEDGELLYSMGSIAIHLFSVEFLLRVSEKLPIHHAHKKVEAWSFDTDRPLRTTVSCIKFEMFIFDTIPMSDRAIFYETVRETEFAPLKNKTGKDSIESCKHLQNMEYTDWLVSSGLADSGFFESVKSGKTDVEISPLFAPDKSIFLEKIAQSTDIVKDALFENDGSLRDQVYIS